jgi:tRNA U34 5-carboxymethylaminomethyl modifying GTPase MnmE/TrmE
MTEIVGKSIPAAADRLKKSPARNPEEIEVIRKKNSDNLSQNVLSFQLIYKNRLRMKRVRDEVRILLIGDRNVGKTSLILSLVRKPINQYR